MKTEAMVVLVDEHDIELGTMNKLIAHERGVLHRAFSVFILNEKNEMLIHQRALGKYHSPGLWTNACCSHPESGDDVHTAAMRRLNEEMGLICQVKKLFAFTYKSDVGNGLYEHEFDHVFVGYVKEDPSPDAGEVLAWQWINTDLLQQNISDKPTAYTSWFKIALPLVMGHLNKSPVISP